MATTAMMHAADLGRRLAILGRNRYVKCSGMPAIAQNRTLRTFSQPLVSHTDYYERPDATRHLLSDTVVTYPEAE